VEDEPPSGTFAPWFFCASPPGAILRPEQLEEAKLEWLPAVVPGTVAMALRAAGRWELDRPLNADDHDWWYRTEFAAPASRERHCRLVLDGLATLAEVWLNGECILSSKNMFRRYQIDLAPYLQPVNVLALAFRSLTAALQDRRPRPRWKTNLVSHQQLRWYRTTLQGRIPSWSPPVPAVGPWQSIRLDTYAVKLSDLRLSTSLEPGIGVVALRCRLEASAPVKGLLLRVGDVESVVSIDGRGDYFQGRVRIPDPPLWWPHTHGEQPRLECTLVVATESEVHTVALGAIGFRHLEIPSGRGFEIRVNGVPVYCRGMCWTPVDIAALAGTEESFERALRLVRDSGANMLRVVGTMVYESDRFYELCDEYGIMVWQDFMFANMDYPVEDAGFAAEIELEAREQLARLSRHPSIVLYCGNSEVEQQAAMLGVPPQFWRNRWFAEQLPALGAEYHPSAAYVASSPSGGTMPFHVREGVSHYYGVGAYLRPVGEVRRADVQFTSECLGFSNLPEAATINALAGGLPLATHNPKWKERVPRDSGAGWDFEDVRDWYLREFFSVDPVRLRSFDLPRYLQLSRVVTGEIMSQVFSEWRSSHSNNRGGLVWFFKDLWPGAGWGIVDSLGIPKAAYYYLRRTWATRQVVLTDEGLDGLHLHIINETKQPLNGSIELMLLKDGHIVVARNESPCMVAPRSIRTLESDDLLNGFHDANYAYRFGPLKHDLAMATLLDDERQVVSEAVYFVQRRAPPPVSGGAIQATAVPMGAADYRVELKSDRFLQSVCLDADEFLPDDNYFHLPPNRTKTVRLRSRTGTAVRFKVYVEALNLPEPVRVSTISSAS
jgi:beta-mannosidase